MTRNADDSSRLLYLPLMRHLVASLNRPLFIGVSLRGDPVALSDKSDEIEES